MFDKLEEVVARYESIGNQLQNPEVTNDQKKYRALMKEYADLGELVETYREFSKLKSDLESAKSVLESESDEELRELAKVELAELTPKIEQKENDLKILLLPKNPNDDKNIILEIRAGAGGDEASLFADELLRAYTHYANEKGWKVDIMSISEGNAGGIKEGIVSVTGDKVYSRLKFESGVHRVQRVPKTESQGRIHTSTITVSVLPEADEVDVEVNPNDLRVDVYRSSGHGGQSVNTTDSAVRITHIPTGIVVTCQDEKSQLKNKQKAMKVLYSRLLSIEQEKQEKEASESRLAQIGTGDRSEKIRTYNFPQSRVTDHRIGLTIHQLDDVMKGHFEHLIQPLVTHYQTLALKESMEN